MNKLKIKRIYLPYDEEDGYRILIDRLWPRGISKTNAAIDEHYKDITPSTEIRKTFGHKEENYKAFAENYRNETRANKQKTAITSRFCRTTAREKFGFGRPTIRNTFCYGAEKAKTCNAWAIILFIDWIYAQSLQMDITAANLGKHICLFRLCIMAAFGFFVKSS